MTDLAYYVDVLLRVKGKRKIDRYSSSEVRDGRSAPLSEGSKAGLVWESRELRGKKEYVGE